MDLFLVALIILAVVHLFIAKNITEYLVLLAVLILHQLGVL